MPFSFDHVLNARRFQGYILEKKMYKEIEHIRICVSKCINAIT